MRSRKFDDAFAVQTGQTVDHHKLGIRPFAIHRCEGFGKVFRLAYWKRLQ